MYPCVHVVADSPDKVKTVSSVSIHLSQHEPEETGSVYSPHTSAKWGPLNYPPLLCKTAMINHFKYMMTERFILHRCHQDDNICCYIKEQDLVQLVCF